MSIDKPVEIPKLDTTQSNYVIQGVSKKGGEISEDWKNNYKYVRDEVVSKLSEEDILFMNVIETIHENVEPKANNYKLRGFNEGDSDWFSVGAEGIVFPKNEDVPVLLDELANVVDLQLSVSNSKDKSTVGEVYKLASFVYLTYVSIHPPFDGAGRESEHVFNYILNKFDIKSVNFHSEKSGELFEQYMRYYKSKFFSSVDRSVRNLHKVETNFDYDDDYIATRQTIVLSNFIKSYVGGESELKADNENKVRNILVNEMSNLFTSEVLISKQND